MSRSIHPKGGTEEARERLLKDFQHLSEEIDSLMNGFFGDQQRMAPSPGRGFCPPMDVFETETEILCLLDLVGVAPQDLDIRLDAGALFITGMRHEIPGFEHRQYHKMELDFGPFERILTIPEPVVANSLRVENLGGFYLVRLRKVFSGLRPVTEVERSDEDPRR
ncbi:MAG: Hsp20/alpha crystallin family protein [Candidatus Zixiibacteriota bacterium]|nr:MAG: Hsp20/alpha crystallin family protein [candidate division Zixibacteria bacterium]